MSSQYPGGLIRSTPVSITNLSGSGVFTLVQALQYRGQDSWPLKLITESIRFDGTTTWTVPTGVTSIDYVVVAGGGSGGMTYRTTPTSGGGGGGGAGGFRTGGNLPVTPGETLTLTVGAGGSSGAGTSGSLSSLVSTANTIESAGGGRGAYKISGSPFAWLAAQSGGSGGGGAVRTPQSLPGVPFTLAAGNGNVPATSPVQGYNGGAGNTNGSGYWGGGGGGASEAGTPANVASDIYGVGGDGLPVTVGDFSVTLAGGGGGGAQSAPTLAPARVPGGIGGGGSGATEGVPNEDGEDGESGTGGGGGGSIPVANPGFGIGGNGGSGTIIISYTRAPTEYIYKFEGSAQWVVPEGVTAVDYLIVGGGGAGGFQRLRGVPPLINPATNQCGAGGGGGGGFRTGSAYPVTPGSTLVIQVGGGGVGYTPSVVSFPAYSPIAVTPSGNSSYIDVLGSPDPGTTRIESAGGGTGKFYTTPSSAATSPFCNGGSGGGGSSSLPSPSFELAYRPAGTGNSPAVVPSQGNNGGDGGEFGGGGGGGAFSVGSVGSSSPSPLAIGGDGGAGEVSSITGVSVTYAGGGGGGSIDGGGAGGAGGGGAGGDDSNQPTSGLGVAGSAATGGGGGGSEQVPYISPGAAGPYIGNANGGSGVIILKPV